ncbi:von willebrand factor type C domain-containing protein [Ditylenchus destructor]|nr:von willebrand factor type C domain-containing protein [Ditylenchus destructor]
MRILHAADCASTSKTADDCYRNQHFSIGKIFANNSRDSTSYTQQNSVAAKSHTVTYFPARKCRTMVQPPGFRAKFSYQLSMILYFVIISSLFFYSSLATPYTGLTNDVQSDEEAKRYITHTPPEEPMKDTRQVGEICGETAGICAPGSQCIFANGNRSIGKCEELDCLKAKCKVLFPQCSSDSRPIARPPPPGECCAKEVVCKCDYQRCYRFIPKCGPGLERVLVSQATFNPGSCCDRFECQEPELRCEHIRCPDPSEVADPYSLQDEQSCPEDSFKPAAYVPRGSCCPLVSPCRCRAGHCPPVRCAPTEIAVIERKGDGRPGHCCDIFTCQSVQLSSKTLNYCMHKGLRREEGEQWHQGACHTCACQGGVALCRRMECPSIPPHCNWVDIPPGECCPVCLGCKDEITSRRIGESWAKDGCTNCTCGDDFRWRCQKFICKSDCENPRKVEGECCPVCDDPLIFEPPIVCPSLELCSLRCEFGLVKNQWGCFECKCATASRDTETNTIDIEDSAENTCALLTSENCNKQCAHGYLRDANGCPTCKCAKCPLNDSCFKHCLYGFQTNSLGCPVCKCRAKSSIDVRLMIPEQALVLKEDDGCFTSTTSGKDLLRRDSGEWWTDNHCRQCFCQNNKIFCSLLSCPNKPDNCADEHWILKNGECCPSCSIPSLTFNNTVAVNEHRGGIMVCHSPGNGRLFVDGETWRLNECIACTCRMGHLLCSAMECPPVPCENPILDPNNRCCARCPEKVELIDITESTEATPITCIDDRGIAHPKSSEWNLDDCTSCACGQEGNTKCFKRKCANAFSKCKNSLMIKGLCCPICSDDLSSGAICIHKDNVYSINEEFRDGNCRNCSCHSLYSFEEGSAETIFHANFTTYPQSEGSGFYTIYAICISGGITLLMVAMLLTFLTCYRLRKQASFNKGKCIKTPKSLQNNFPNDLKHPHITEALIPKIRNSPSECDSEIINVSVSSSTSGTSEAASTYITGMSSSCNSAFSQARSQS